MIKLKYIALCNNFLLLMSDEVLFWLLTTVFARTACWVFNLRFGSNDLVVQHQQKHTTAC